LIRISAYKALLSHSRFLLNLRSQQGRYHSLILFRLSSGSSELPSGEPSTGAVNAVDPCSSDGTEKSGDLKVKYNQIYVMESTCPHLGADLSHAEIEECETSIVAVCPWHRWVLLQLGCFTEDGI
jgi:nitrite reductase/ring-hydroxylating ferredoxin subunit